MSWNFVGLLAEDRWSAVNWSNSWQAGWWPAARPFSFRTLRNAILEIHPGSGGMGTGQGDINFVCILDRCQKTEVEVLDYQAGDETGIKSCDLILWRGPNTYDTTKSQKWVFYVWSSPLTLRHLYSFTSVSNARVDDTISGMKMISKMDAFPFRWWRWTKTSQ